MPSEQVLIQTPELLPSLNLETPSPSENERGAPPSLSLPPSPPTYFSPPTSLSLPPSPPTHLSLPTSLSASYIMTNLEVQPGPAFLQG